MFMGRYAGVNTAPVTASLMCGDAIIRVALHLGSRNWAPTREDEWGIVYVNRGEIGVQG